MHRCLQLATLGVDATPNPKVGAVLVYNDTIIGEGYHKQYGKAHAEVNCINSVCEENKQFIHQSTLYVSLEPCTHTGKTPPCTDLIIAHKIPIVIIACRDSFAEVNGKGVKQLQEAGVTVIEGILQQKAYAFNAGFFTFHQKRRPYIILKWAQSLNAQIAGADFAKVKISNEFTDRLVHKWRSEADAILVGRKTALYDDPVLTNRYWKGKSPLRLVIDPSLSLPVSLQLFNQEYPTVVFNDKKAGLENNIRYQQLEKNKTAIHSILDYLFNQNIQTVLVEGGTTTLQSFIDAGLWDEAKVITNEELIIDNGIAAPQLKDMFLLKKYNIYNNDIKYFINNK